ncbi:hypothetical protein [Kitasatospora sp. NPDC092286]|uniref:hypothetical protein n=1 Tax=Kitasatospora sp. NPDC092286 TaxID=3364087 RepID=UPI0037F8B85A
MPYSPTLADLAELALAEKRAQDRRRTRAGAGDAGRFAHVHATEVLGAGAAGLLDWEDTSTYSGEYRAARAAVPGTPGWYLRWAGDEDGDTDKFELLRPCAHVGHRNHIHGLAELGALMEQLNDN